MAINISSGDLLTSEQLNRHFAIYAGPGAGKTHFLVNNMKNIIESHPKVAKSCERKVLCITYTNAAVNEIAKRLSGYNKSIEVCTIHNFILKHIILPFQGDLKRVMQKDFGITITRKANIIAQIEGLGILHGYEKDKINADLQRIVGPHNEYGKKILSEVQVDAISFINKGICKLKYSSQIDRKHVKAIKEYIWNTVGRITFDEILYFGYRMLQENSTIIYALRVEFPFIFIDEFQDTNPLQTCLIKYLGEKSTIIGVIGDVAQSIYSFQGAHPSDFINFSMPGKLKLDIYQITGNRRSSENIVNFCNYIRNSDGLEQQSIKEYDSEIIKQEYEKKPIHFLCGSSKKTMEKITSLVEQGTVVLTRTWAGAFLYIQNIDDEQKSLLKRIYNSYYPTSIDIRSDIVEYNRVIWVRAFRFMIMLQTSYKNGSIIDLLNALSLYTNQDIRKKRGMFTPSVILKIKKLLKQIFRDVNESTLICSKIVDLNTILQQDEYKEICRYILEDEDFSISYTSYFEKNIQADLEKIKWSTAQKLFDNVFSKNAQYMTVHQAKGLEWENVIVAVSPTRNDHVDLCDALTSPNILGENSIAEFIRIYYVACSRAKNELYIHVPDDKMIDKIKKSLNDYKKEKGCVLKYEFI